MLRSSSGCFWVSTNRFTSSAFMDVHEQVYVLDVGGRGRKARPLLDVLGFRGNGVLLLLRLSEAGLQQRLDLFLTGPEAVLRRQEAHTGVSKPEDDPPRPHVRRGTLRRTRVYSPGHT